MNEKVLERMTKSRVSLMLDFPFFGVLALGLRLEEREGIGTAATDGKNLYYNTEFIESLTDAELNWVMIHEIMHPVLGHLWRKGDRFHQAWNIACDLALHDVMMEYLNINIGQKDKLSMPDGCLYDVKYKGMSAEQIYDTFDVIEIEKACGTGGSGKGTEGLKPLDNHDIWGEADAKEIAEEWGKKIVEASIASQGVGNMPAGLKRVVDRLVNPKKDWRVLLNEFVEREVTDYSFSPPDRRFSDYDFFMPDFNEEEETVKNIIFLIDTSGSVGVKELVEFYSELIGAINQFSTLEGKLGFFDHECYGLTDFVDATSLTHIKPVGGGGTSFINALKYVKDHTDADDVAGIIMFTDGYAEFPDESITRGVPVLWVISENSNIIPPWGAHTSLKQD